MVSRQSQKHYLVKLSSESTKKSDTHVNAGFRRHLQVLRLLGNTDQYRSSGKGVQNLGCSRKGQHTEYVQAVSVERRSFVLAWVVLKVEGKKSW